MTRSPLDAAEAIVSEWNRALVDVMLDYLGVGMLIVGFGVLFRKKIAEKGIR